MKLYCVHKWDIDFACNSGITAKCRRCGCYYSGKNDIPENWCPTVIAVSEDELPKESA